MRAVSRAALVVMFALAGAACATNEQAVDYTDAGIKARVEAALRGRRDIDPRYISVDVEHGVVTLTGIVPSSEMRPVIDRLIKGVAGVDTLLDNLIVQD